MSFIDSIKIRAKKDIKTIVLPEGNDIRTIEAVEKVRKEQFADVIVLGNKDEILNMAKEHNINIDGVKIINHTVKRLQRFYVIEDDEQEHIFTK